MPNKDYLQRVITWKSDEKVSNSKGETQPIYATRMRDNNGFQMIVIHFGDQKIEFHNDNCQMVLLDNKLEPLPEAVAGEVFKVLDDAIMNRCELPKTK